MIITIGRKPFSVSTTKNIMAHECGGINIGECRIGSDLRVNRCASTNNQIYNTTWVGKQTEGTACLGRFPSNVILSESSMSHLPKATQGHWANAKITGYGDKIGEGSVEYFGAGEKDNSGGSVAKYFLIVG